jgi:molybdopterin converting factor small subunit
MYRVKIPINLKNCNKNYIYVSYFFFFTKHVRIMPSEIKIVLHAIFREITGRKEIIEILESENCTVKAILNRLAMNYGKDFKEIIDPETQQISNDILVMLNGKSLRSTDKQLENKDTILISIAVAGG